MGESTGSKTQGPESQEDQGLARLLHEERTRLLEELPGPRETMLSAGCAGSWYFEWINTHCGRPRRHIGLERYAPRPERLPEEVEWVAASVSDMRGVGDASVDLVFSGQNLEHLWPDDILGFLRESRRVLRPGGHLVVDSPNRKVTSPLSWMHHEHVLELSPVEIRELLRVAGFDVGRLVGIWVCRDPATGRLLPLDPVADAEWPVSRRRSEARDNPDDSFIWWAEAVRRDDSPDDSVLGRRLEEIAGAAMDERMTRWTSNVGSRLRTPDGETWVETSPGEGGALRYGPYVPLRPGNYRVTFEVRVPPGAPLDDHVLAVVDVVTSAGDEPLVRHEVRGGVQPLSRVHELSLDFSLDDVAFGVQFRAFSTAVAGIVVSSRVRLAARSAGPG